MTRRQLGVPRKRILRKDRRHNNPRECKLGTGERPPVAIRNPLSDLTREQLDEVVRHHHQNGAVGRLKLLNLLMAGNWKVILSQLSVYRLMLAVEDGARVQLDDEPVQPCVEYIQALALSLPQTSDVPQLSPYPLAEEALDYASAVLLAETLPKEPAAPSEDVDRTTALASMRAHAVLVRGPGYPHQVERITSRIAKRTATRGPVGAPLVLQLLDACERRVVDAVRQWRLRVGPAARVTSWKQASLVLADNWGFPESEAMKILEPIRDTVPDSQSALVLVGLLELDLPRAFTLSAADLAVDVGISEEHVRAILQRLSLAPGELENHELDRIPAENPCWNRPFVQVVDGYFLPVPGLLHSFKYDILARALSGDESMLNSYRRARSSVLEAETAEHLSRVFGAEHVHTGLKWVDPSEPDREYETDVVVVLDNFLIVAECKSHAACDAARRGAPKASATLGKNVFLSAATQSARLVALLSGAEVPVTLTTAAGQRISVVPNPTRSAIRLTVTLDFIGGSASRTSKQASVAGRGGDYAVAMPVTDLEIVCDALDCPEQLLHYLHCRQLLERRLMYLGDETDLLGLYLKTRFAGDMLFDDGAILQLSPLGRMFDSWYLPQPSVASGARSRLRNTPLWQRFIDCLKRSGREGWVRGAAMLSGVPVDGQRLAEQGIGTLRRRVLAAADFLVGDDILILDTSGRGDEVIAIWVHPEHADLSVVRERTLAAARNVVAKLDADWIIVIAVPTTASAEWPYTCCWVARRDRQKSQSFGQSRPQ